MIAFKNVFLAVKNDMIIKLMSNYYKKGKHPTNLPVFYKKK